MQSDIDLEMFDNAVLQKDAGKNPEAFQKKYIDFLKDNIESRFEGKGMVSKLTVFEPAQIPAKDAEDFKAYSGEQIKELSRHRF